MRSWIIILLVSTGFVTVAQDLAFPGAEGYGKFASGGRGGRVLIVSNLNDHGPGSLRAAVREDGPRIITFSVSGTIALESSLPIDNGDVTIAGQSAPGDGICIRNYPLRISADNVIIRYMRFRLGDEKKTEDDAINGRHSDRVIIDHCSISWSTDECASFYGNSNFTLQWSIISESLNNSVHSKGAHGYGGIWGGAGATFHHNLIAHHASRNPRFSGSSSTRNSESELTDFRNNVIFNWGFNSTYGGEGGRYNIVNNYYKAGPATDKSKRDRIVNPSKPYGAFYVAGNVVEGFSKISEDNWNGGIQCESPELARADKPFDTMVIDCEESAEDAFNSVLKSAGASHCRDAVDKRIVREVRTGITTFGDGILNTQETAGGWPVLKSKSPRPDGDNDGMPDAWEKKYGLDPADASDASSFMLNEQFSNVEVYLNELVQ